MAKKDGFRELVDTDLTGCRIVEMTEVYYVDKDGKFSRSVGFLKDPDVALAFAEAQVDPVGHKTRKAVVLTDGKVGYVMVPGQVILLDDEKEFLSAKDRALGRLSPAQRRLLKLQ